MSHRHDRRGVTRARVIVAVALALILGLQASPASARTDLVVARPPLKQSVQDLVGGRFFQYATCSERCRASFTVAITPKLAKRLGFRGVRSSGLFVIARAQRRLAAKRRTKVVVPLTRQARTVLRRARGQLKLTGQVTARTLGRPARTGGAAWAYTCVWRP